MIFVSSLSIADAAINGRFVAVKRGRMVTSKAYRGFKENLGALVFAQLTSACTPPLLGPCTVSIHLPWPRTCDQDHNRGLPFGDVDSPVKCILDALKLDAKNELGGAYIDDSQVITLLVSKWPRPEQLIVEVLPCTL